MFSQMSEEKILAALLLHLLGFFGLMGIHRFYACRPDLNRGWVVREHPGRETRQMNMT